MAAGIVERVAVASVQVRPARIALTALTLPLYLLGFLAGLLFVVVRFGVGALQVGFADAGKRRQLKPSPVGDD